MDEVIKEFLVESYENLEQLDRDLVALEKNPSDQETLASVFRSIHTIKGTCGFLDFSKLESVTHAGETLLSSLRDGKLLLSHEITTELLSMLDAVRQIMGSIETDGGEGDADYAALIEKLVHLQETNEGSPAAIKPEPEDHVSVIPLSPDERDVEGAGRPQELSDSVKGRSESRPSIAESSIRVDVGLMDKLMNLVGELVLARNQILQFAIKQDNAAFLGTSQRLSLVTTELQEGIMTTRMQPIANVWNKFPRVVRDLAQACGKQIRIDMEGEGTELDKTIIESINDPLTHIVRNSADHGIETSDVRTATGKAVEGRISLRAFHEGGQVNIEISDDGAGIDAMKVKAKAVERGVITPEQAGVMSEREALNLVFLPGFSTAQKVSNISGRGVGMDVVRTNIEKIGGTVDIHSVLGKGTTVKIKIPLTLAIIPALLVACGGSRYAIPQVSLLELVRLEGADATTRVEMIHGAPVYRLRGELLPLVYLSRELGIDDATDQPRKRRESTSLSSRPRIASSA